jgi:hypothetical protein
MRNVKKPVSGSKQSRKASGALCRTPFETLEDRRMFAILGIEPLMTHNPDINAVAVGSGSVNANVDPVTEAVTYTAGPDTGVTYNSLTQQFKVDSTPTSFKLNGTTQLLQGTRDLYIEVHVSATGVGGNAVDQIDGNDLIITGQVDLNGDGIIQPSESGTLLTGEIALGQFGSQPTDATHNNTYDFRFTPTGGILSSYFVNKDIGVRVFSNANPTDFNGSFTNSFSADQASVLVSPIPLKSTGGPGTASLSGYVYQDTNNDGLIQPTETALKNVSVQLSGTDDFGNTVGLSTTTDSSGFYSFQNLQAGNYTIREDQPAGYADGKDTVGSEGDGAHPAGYIYPAGTDTFPNIRLNAGTLGTGYNYGEGAKTSTDNLHKGDTATIGFWQNKNGQALLNKLNGGGTSGSAYNLGNWLATNFPNMYGPTTTSNTAGLSNSQIADLYVMSRFKVTGVKLDAQVMATAFAVYATNQTLAGGNYAGSYGFDTSGTGTGSAYYNVGSNGAAFGFVNNSTHTIMDYLVATNLYARNGILWDTDSSGTISSSEQALRDMANVVFSGINQTGDIS